MKFNFHFGKKEPSYTKRIAVAMFFVSVVPLLSKVTRVKEQSLYDFIDEIVRSKFPDSVFNEYILKTPLIDRRIERDINREIEKLTKDLPPVIIEKPIFVEEPSDGSEAQNLLGGAMELKSPWTTNNED